MRRRRNRRGCSRLRRDVSKAKGAKTPRGHHDRRRRRRCSGLCRGSRRVISHGPRRTVSAIKVPDYRFCIARLFPSHLRETGTHGAALLFSYRERTARGDASSEIPSRDINASLRNSSGPPRSLLTAAIPSVSPGLFLTRELLPLQIPSGESLPAGEEWSDTVESLEKSSATFRHSHSRSEFPRSVCTVERILHSAIERASRTPPSQERVPFNRAKRSLPYGSRVYSKFELDFRPLLRAASAVASRASFPPVLDEISSTRRFQSTE